MKESYLGDIHQIRLKNKREKDKLNTRIKELEAESEKLRANGAPSIMQNEEI